MSIDMDVPLIVAHLSIHDARAIRTAMRYQRRKVHRQIEKRGPFTPARGRIDVEQARLEMYSRLEAYLNNLIDQAIAKEKAK